MGICGQQRPIKKELFVSKLNNKEIIEIRDKVIKVDNQLNSINFQIQTGQMRNNNKEGVGECISYIENSEIQNNKIKDYYLGQWKNDMRHGYGMMVYYNGNQYDYYVGEFQLNKRHGQGEIKYSNMQQYKGQFENDVFHGKGKFILQDEITYYDGDWIENERHGFGIENGIDENKIWKYEGQFLTGKRHGKGKLIIDGECEIEGEFENDHPKNATIIYKQKQFQDYIYKGQLAINDQQEAIFEGMGKLTMKNNQIIEGEFTKHQFNEQAVQAK